jgi:hypothetical protein
MTSIWHNYGAISTSFGITLAPVCAIASPYRVLQPAMGPFDPTVFIDEPREEITGEAPVSG